MADDKKKKDEKKEEKQLVRRKPQKPNDTLFSLKVDDQPRRRRQVEAQPQQRESLFRWPVAASVQEPSLMYFALSVCSFVGVFWLWTAAAVTQSFLLGVLSVACIPTMFIAGAVSRLVSK